MRRWAPIRGRRGVRSSTKSAHAGARPCPASGAADGSHTTRAGATRTLGTFDLDGGDLSFGAATDLDMSQVTHLRLASVRGRPVYVARFQ